MQTDIRKKVAYEMTMAYIKQHPNIMESSNISEVVDKIADIQKEFNTAIMNNSKFNSLF